MTTPEALNELADRVEREEPSRHLDAEIWCAMRGFEFHRYDGGGCVYHNGEWFRHQPDKDTPHMGAKQASAALRARAADMQARFAPHPSPEQKGSEQ